MDYSFLPSLSLQKQAGAIRLSFGKAPENYVGWQYSAQYSTSEKYAILRDTFVVSLKAGATYDFFSHSFFDPFILLVYNKSGAVVAADSGQGSYGSDMIFNFKPATSDDYYISASWNQGISEANKYSSVSVYEREIVTPVATPSAPITVNGTAGIDKVSLAKNHDDYTISISSSAITLVKKETGEVRIYSGVERLAFADKTVAYDTSGNAGQAYRLYKAAFDRAPDKGGLGFWIDKLDKGMSLNEVAGGFIGSAEFIALSGAAPSNLEFTTSLYKHVLARSPDSGGLSWWLNQLETGASSRSSVLVGFSESSENQIAVQGMIQSGIEYTAIG